ncbi:MAG: hypothetical protein Roseis2KO_31110 [Roseivirga sp.]
MLKKIDLEDKLDEIVAVLESKYQECEQVGVLAGTSGISLFFFYYARHSQNNKYAKIANRILEDSLNRIDQGYSFPTYCTGISGFGWALEHLSEEGFLEIDNDELLPDLETYLYLKMRQDITSGYYDFLHGAVGYGFYFLKRYQNTKSPELKKKYASYIHQLLEGLDQLSERDVAGLKWLSEMRSNNEPQKVYNLSLSHGISSIVNFLSRACKFKAFYQSGLPLLKGSMEYVLAQKRNLGDCLFPNAVSETGDVGSAKTRLAWCYGDLGVGLSIYLGAETLNDSKQKETAIRILLRTTERRDLKSCGVIDASPCHGAFGIAQVYGTLFRKTKIPDFHAAADYWVLEGLKLGTYPDGYAGFKQYRTNETPTNEVNILEGVAGIGLTIISCLAGFETRWEESLMIK